MQVRGPVEFASGALFAVIGLLGLWFASDLRMGTSVRMGPGYFPVILCWLLIGLGLIIALRGVVVDGATMEAWRTRPLILVLLSILVFAWSIQKLGVLVAVGLTVATAAAADQSARRAESAFLAAVLAVFCTILFVLALGLPLPVWPYFFRTS